MVLIQRPAHQVTRRILGVFEQLANGTYSKPICSKDVIPAKVGTQRHYGLLGKTKDTGSALSRG